MQVIKDELNQVRNRYGEDRRTTIELGGYVDIDDESLIQEEEVFITLTHFGYVKRMPIDTGNIQHRGGRGVTGMQTREEDLCRKHSDDLDP